MPGMCFSCWRGVAVYSLPGDGATVKFEGRPSCWRGEATGLSLGVGATAAKAKCRAAFSRWRGEATGLSLGGGATAAEAKGLIHGKSHQRRSFVLHFNFVIVVLKSPFSNCFCQCQCYRPTVRSQTLCCTKRHIIDTILLLLRIHSKSC